MLFDYWQINTKALSWGVFFFRFRLSGHRFNGGKKSLQKEQEDEYFNSTISDTQRRSL